MILEDRANSAGSSPQTLVANANDTTRWVTGYGVSGTGVRGVAKKNIFSPPPFLLFSILLSIFSLRATQRRGGNFRYICYTTYTNKP